ncbi:aspartic peptidase domain-containing protein [Biscogniauxia mediterranea]|nr:aspartic peptidase domain-containing protein [Biscogniauxia mediterranea]
MSSRCDGRTMLRNRLAVIIGTLLVPVSVYADEPSALWLAPSHEWYGIDGNWSSTGLLMGDPAQGIDVTVSTSLSEIWVVETTGCGTSSLCTTARGGTCDSSASQSWSSLGPWQLGLGYLDNGGNGDYAMETVAAQDSTRQGQVSFGKQVVAGINDTSYYTGFLGLGITPGKFQNVVVQSPISTLVEHSGIIPSHSYGYTAGAYYGGSRGTPLSLTLGGYDANRFEPHDTKFSLDSITRQPSILLRAITASVSDVGKAPTAWASPSVPLMEFNESVTALIDSSTPYLWLPTTICDRFAASLNLTWDESFGLYVFSNTENLENYQSSPDLSFTFALSSADNHDNFGQPLDVPGIVNITISSQAFIQNLRYPFKNLIPYRSPAVPYFPLTRADNSSQIIIGRSFLQEAYMITNYETSTFSIHQAKFPDDPWTNTSIQTIAFTPNSGYAGPASQSGKQAGLTDAQLAGLVVGIAVIGVAAVAAIWLMRRRKKRGHQEVAKSDHELKEGYSTPEPETPRSPVDRILSRMSMNVPWRRTKRSTGDGHEYGVFEVGADWSHERYEMPVQTKPIELEATQTTLSSIGITDFASKREREPQPRPPHRRSTYEMEKLHLEMAMHGLAPQYTPLADEPGRPYHQQHHHHHTGATWHPGAAAAENHHHDHHPSPTSSPTQQGEEEEDTYSNRLPSPVSPQSDWTNFVPDFPSSVVGLGLGLVPTRTRTRTLSSSNSDPHMRRRRSSGTPPSPPRSIDRLTRSASSSSSTAAGSPPSPSPPRGGGGGIQRTPIDPSRVVCLGPLPDNVRPRPQWPAMFPPPPPPPPPPPVSSSSSPRHRRADEDEDEDEDDFAAAAAADHHRHSRCLSTADTLGSDFTIEEEARQQAARTLGRMGGFDDIVHVPQPAHRRYSWEEEEEEGDGHGGRGIS